MISRRGYGFDCSSRFEGSVFKEGHSFEVGIYGHTFPSDFLRLSSNLGF